MHLGQGTYCDAVESLGIEDVLAAAEDRVRRGEGLAGTGFRGAIAAVKANPEMAERYAARCAAVDQAVFRKRALLVVPIVPGTIIAGAVTAIGVYLMARAPRMGDDPVAAGVFLVGFGIVLVATHGLAHLVTGRLLGIGFTHWFVGSLRRPQPGVKVDYRSYLSATPRRRAVMHVSGAVFSKLIALAAPLVAAVAGLPAWVVWVLVGIAVVSLITDLVWSTKHSDWARFRREMAQAHTL